MAHIERRPNNRYRARYRSPDGQEHSQTFRRKGDAERFLTSVEHSKLTGGYVDPAAGRTTFRAYADEWRLVQVNRPGTAVSIETQLRLHVYPTLGHRPIAAVRTSEIQALVQRLGEHLAPSTIEVVYGRVVAVFRAAVRDRVITTSPCTGIRLPSKPPASMLEVLSTEQVYALVDAIAPRYAALVLTAAGTGLRPGELFGLRTGRVDFLRRTVRVDQQVARLATGGVGLAPLKTQASYRSVPLPQTVADAMAAHLARWPADAGTGVMFTNERSGLIQEHPFSAAWRTAKRKAATPGWATPHDLRHYYASVLIRSGNSVKVLQARLGARIRQDDAGRLRPPVPRRGGPYAGLARRRAASTRPPGSADGGWLRTLAHVV